MAKRATKVVNVLGTDIVANEDYYLNNTNLPKPTSTYEYTLEMIEELDKCRKDIIYFAEHYFYINGINGKEVIKLFDKQRKILRTIQNNKKSLLVTSRQWGKCICGTEKIRVRYKPLGISFKMSIKSFYYLVKSINFIKDIFKKCTFKR